MSVTRATQTLPALPGRLRHRPPAPGAAALLASALLLPALAAPLPGLASSRPGAEAAGGHGGPEGAHAVLLHGLARSSATMSRLAAALAEAGYDTCNVAYPSRRHDVRTLAVEYVQPAVEACFAGDDPQAPVSFVTHSLGGVLTRQLARAVPELHFGRVVMLAPPNGGSALADRFGDLELAQTLLGPALGELGTASTSVPANLGPAPFEVGIIAGDRSLAPWFSAIIPGEDDGRVSLESTRLHGMKDHLVMPVRHAVIMKRPDVIEQVVHFLHYGEFDR